MLEEYVGSTVNRRYVWGLRYIDDLVLRDRSNGGTLNERCYALQDANWNVVAIYCSTAGTPGIVERYAYTAYGVCDFLNASFGSLTASAYDWTVLYTGRALDDESGMYYYRMRYYHPELGVFLGTDPVRSDENRFRYCYSRPVNMVDTYGLYPIGVCCSFSSNGEIWSETNWCDSSVTPGSCCKARAVGWGIFRAWSVIAAHYNECNTGSKPCKWYIQQTGVTERADPNPSKRNAANIAGGHWNLVSSCHGVVWSGWFGPSHEKWSMDPSLPTNSLVFGYIFCEQKQGGALKWRSERDGLLDCKQRLYRGLRKKQA